MSIIPSHVRVVHMMITLGYRLTSVMMQILMELCYRMTFSFGMTKFILLSSKDSVTLISISVSAISVRVNLHCLGSSDMTSNHHRDKSFLVIYYTNNLRNTLYSTITYTTYTLLFVSIKLHIKKDSH